MTHKSRAIDAVRLLDGVVTPPIWFHAPLLTIPYPLVYLVWWLVLGIPGYVLLGWIGIGIGFYVFLLEMLLIGGDR